LILIKYKSIPTTNLHDKIPPWSLFSSFLDLLLPVWELTHDNQIKKLKDRRIEKSFLIF
jgi:hypothetical protein